MKQRVSEGVRELNSRLRQFVYLSFCAHTAIFVVVCACKMGKLGLFVRSFAGRNVNYRILVRVFVFHAFSLSPLK